MIVAQVRAVAQDIGVDAVKVGMLGDQATIAAVLEALDLLEADTPVVVDPVMVAESGAVLLEPGARAALAEALLPRATVVTPNLAEARVLATTGGAEAPAAGADEAEQLARAVLALGPAAVVVTGGHRERGRRRLPRRRGAWSRSPASASPTAPRTARAARTPRLWPPGWPLGLDPLQAARRAREIAGRGGARRPARAGAGSGAGERAGAPRQPAAGAGGGPRALS